MKAVDEDADRRRRIKEAHPVVGRLAAAMTPKPMMAPESQSTRAWAIGAEGERRVAEILNSCAGLYALHDRRIPGSTANIDHIAVTPAATYVIDAKKYDGEIEARDVGGWLQSDVRLFVNGRDRTKVVDGMARQVETVRRVLAGGYGSVPVHSILCFVDAGWPRFRRRPLSIRGTIVVWPDGLPAILEAEVGAPTYDAGP